MPSLDQEYKKGVLDIVCWYRCVNVLWLWARTGLCLMSDMISAELCNWLRVFIIISPGPVHLQTLDIPRTIIRHYHTIAITISQLRTRWIFNWKCERCCESSELILVFSSRHEFVLSNLCRMYCYNLNNSINSFFQQNKFYCFILLTICLLKSSERSIFSVGK